MEDRVFTLEANGVPILCFPVEITEKPKAVQVILVTPP